MGSNSSKKNKEYPEFMKKKNYLQNRVMPSNKSNNYAGYKNRDTQGAAAYMYGSDVYSGGGGGGGDSYDSGGDTYGGGGDSYGGGGDSGGSGGDCGGGGGGGGGGGD